MQVNPYLSFEGRCEEAIEFYKTAVGAKVNAMMRFNEAPASCGPGMVRAGDEKKIMHACLNIGDSVVMASDGRCTRQMKFDGTSLCITVKTDAEAERYFAALSDGGTICVPIAKTFFASRFGIVNDRFGVPWMVIVMP
jgi:PhnB protein